MVYYVFIQEKDRDVSGVVTLLMTYLIEYMFQTKQKI